MNLYLISQDENNGYDTYDSAIVAAKSEEEAKKIDPSGKNWEQEWSIDCDLAIGVGFGSWATKPENVAAKLIGIASTDIPPGVVLASFNAG